MSTYLEQITQASDSARLTMGHLRQSLKCESKPIERLAVVQLLNRAAELQQEIYSLLVALQDSQ